MKKNRSTAYRRYARNKAILRRKRICREVYGFQWYHVDGRYAKGKIHCSCGLCTYGKKQGLPSLRDEREAEQAKSGMDDYLSAA